MSKKANYGGPRTLPAFHAMLTIFCKVLQTNVWSGLLMAGTVVASRRFRRRRVDDVGGGGVGLV
jgi:hypothetical protein